MTNLKKILSGELLNSKLLKENSKFLLLIFLIAFFYVIYGAYGVFQVAKIDEKEKKIENLRQKSILLSSELMKISLESQVYEQVQKYDIGLQKLSEPPKRIIIYTEKEKHHRK